MEFIVGGDLNAKHMMTGAPGNNQRNVSKTSYTRNKM